MRKRFDQFAKQSLVALLDRAGTTLPETEVQADAQTIDAWFVPDPTRAARRRELGLLGRTAARPALYEPFHEPPGVPELRACLRKQLAWHHELERRVQATGSHDGVPFPMLWVLSAGRPTAVLRGYALRPLHGWPTGVYAPAGAAWHLRVVVISELPRTRATLPLRLLGAGTTLARALADLMALPVGAWERQTLVPLLVQMRYAIEQDPTPRTPEEEEFMLSPKEMVDALQREARDQGKVEGKAEGKAEGIAVGKAEGIAEALRRVCARRGLALTKAQRAKIDACTDLPTLNGWLDGALVATTAREVFVTHPPA